MKTLHTRQRWPINRSGESPRSRSFQFPVVRVALLVLFLLSIYVEVPLYLTEPLFVPSFFTLLILMPILAVLYFRRIYRYEAIFVVQILCVLCLSVLLSPGFAYADQKLLGLLQTIVSIVGGILLFRLLNSLQQQRIA